LFASAAGFQGSLSDAIAAAADKSDPGTVQEKSDVSCQGDFDGTVTCLTYYIWNFGLYQNCGDCIDSYRFDDAPCSELVSEFCLNGDFCGCGDCKLWSDTLLQCEKHIDCGSQTCSGGGSTPAPVPASTPAPVPAPSEDDGGRGCFSGTDTVQVWNKGTVAMNDLEVGDKVLTGKNNYEPIYSFGHKHKTAFADFIWLQTDKTSLTLTGLII
jgi:hypothetical protein